MSRNMSFALTKQQVRDQTKTVTRRNGWVFLKVGDELNAVEKAMGLRKGEKIKRLARIRVLSVRRERIVDITDEDVAREGFPNWWKIQFIDLYCKANKCAPTDECTRIEFEYIGPREPS